MRKKFVGNFYNFRKSFSKPTSQIYALFLDIFFPLFCLSCGKYGDCICFDCVEKIEKVKTITCVFCGKIEKTGICKRCKAREKIRLNKVFVATRYDGVVKKLVYGLKYEKLFSAGDVLAELMLERIETEDFKNFVIIPVPLHKSREKSRGFNQSEILSRKIAENLKLPIKNLLTRVRETESQVGKSKEERARNVEEAFSCVNKKFTKDKNMLLVDDVATTLSTLNECAKALKKSGAKKIYALVAAHG